MVQLAVETKPENSYDNFQRTNDYKMYFLEDLDEEDYEIAIKVSYVKSASNGSIKIILKYILNIIWAFIRLIILTLKDIYSTTFGILIYLS